jgi:serine/threonine protein kinase
MQPEPSTTSDVYSFGVVLLELVTGRPPILHGPQPTSVIQWTRQHLARGDTTSRPWWTRPLWEAATTSTACGKPRRSRSSAPSRRRRSAPPWPTWWRCSSSASTSRRGRRAAQAQPQHGATTPHTEASATTTETAARPRAWPTVRTSSLRTSPLMTGARAARLKWNMYVLG